MDSHKYNLAINQISNNLFFSPKSYKETKSDAINLDTAAATNAEVGKF